MKDPRHERGRAAEEEACRYLEGKGYEILEKNFRTRYGEIDIIARRGQVVPFIEVKARRGSSHGEPFESVGPRKQGQIRRMAQMWLAMNQADRSLREAVFRFDVISIRLSGGGDVPRIEHMTDAFR